MDPTTARIVARYECKNLPNMGGLFRVQYDGSTSLRARTRPVFQTEQEFKNAVEMHLDWTHSEPTPFVSTFREQEHAINWARQRVNTDRSAEAVVLSLLIAGLNGHIFRVRDLVQHHDVETDLPESMYRDEYLVLDRIYHRSIIDETSEYYRLSDTLSGDELSQYFSHLSTMDTSPMASSDEDASSGDEQNENFSRLQVP